MANKYKIICHRGINRLDENSFKSITDVINLSNNEKFMYGVEFDIQLTIDDNIICYHDETLKRLHDSTKKVCDLSKNDIDYFNLPLFNDVMKVLSQNKDLIIDVELKIYEPYDIVKLKKLCRETLDICKKNNIIDQCVFTSFEIEIIKELLSNDKNIKVGLIIDHLIDINILIELKKNGMNHIVMDRNTFYEILDLNTNFLENYDIYIYTLFSINFKNEHEKDIELINKIKNKKIGFITDNYEKILNLLNN